jgi:hypothetical protein
MQTLLYFSIVLDFRTFLSVDFVYSVYPCPVETSSGSILLLWSFYTLFTLCPSETKRGSICQFWTGNVFSTQSSDFCPRMAKWGVRLFLCWQHYVGQNHFYVMFLLSQGCCFIQSLHFSYELQEDSVQNSNQSV